MASPRPAVRLPEANLLENAEEALKICKAQIHSAIQLHQVVESDEDIFFKRYQRARLRCVQLTFDSDQT